MEVFKFGGASVKDAESIQNMREIVESQAQSQLVIVVSAMGKTTNELQTIADQILSGEPIDDQVLELLNRHEETCRGLLGEIPKKFIETKQDFFNDIKAPPTNELEFSDRIISYGELFSTIIIAACLGAVWLDARDLIKTDTRFSEAEVDWDITTTLIKERFTKSLNKSSVVVTQGFIGSEPSGRTTTLGREGSDFSAAIFAHSLDATSLTVWKDVPGLLTADPKVLPNALKFDHISYQEVIEMTYYGAKVIHPKTIYPLAQKGIPLYVRSFLNPETDGTEISEDKKVATIPCFVFKQSQMLFTIRVKDNSFMDELKMSQILATLSKLHIKANLMHNSALTFTVCMDQDERKEAQLIDALSPIFHVLYNEGLWLLTIKNYDQYSFSVIPDNAEKIIEEQTRMNYQVVYRLNESS
ncbi:aspartate kinase [Marinoscillum sp. MHG1-6]|uniref:aspartate kinase n=1 Tax=Marinoscillum sp. MHG1-6 TaxID=2959627 RepID=UPI002157399F|nr:aspartate kinase [Marinoscillum sp. MHG1-6]